MRWGLQTATGPINFRELTTDRAVYADQGGRQRIVLAFEPTGRPLVVNVPPDMAAAEAAALHYMTFVLLDVEAAGGTAQIGQPTPFGRIGAELWSYTKDRHVCQMARAVGGTISTRRMPRIGLSGQGGWLIDGTFDLRMTSQVRLIGKFRAVPDAELIDRFVRNKSL